MRNASEKILAMANGDINFLQLKARISIFNPFEVLGVKDFEIRHSNVLSWLLDPFGSHCMGDYFLRRLLIDFIAMYAGFEGLDLASIQRPFYGVRVHREYKTSAGKYIDILIVIESLRIIFLIENKIKAKEYKGQLKGYCDYVEGKFHGFKVFPIYLTLDGDEPSDPRYMACSYSSIVDYLEIIISIKKDVIPKAQHEFICQYRNTIKEALGMIDEKSIELAKIIYKENKDVIDFIINYAESNVFSEACSGFFNKNKYTRDGSSGRAIFFSDEKLKEIQSIRVDQWFGKQPIAYWFKRIDDSRIGLIIEVGPVSDAEVRTEILNLLEVQAKAQGIKFKINEAAKKSGRKYTRIYSLYKDFSDFDQAELIEAMLGELINAASPYINCVHEFINSYVVEKKIQGSSRVDTV